MSQLKVDDIVDAAGTGPVSFSLGSNPNISSANGSDANTTLTSASARWQIVTPTADRNYTLPGDSKQGESWRITNTAAAASGFDISVLADDASTVWTVAPRGSLEVISLVDNPSTNTDWLVLPSSTNRWHERFLSTDYSTGAGSGDIGDLSYNNLTVGRSYRVYLKVRFSADNATNSIIVTIYDQAAGAGNVLGRVSFDEIVSTGSQVMDMSFSGVFTAQQTTLRFRAESMVAADIIRGNGTRTETHVILEELSNLVETDSL